MNTEKRRKSEQACQAGENFAKLFYETLDRKRHALSNLYLDTALVVWNGNSYPGKDSIAKFYESLPESVTDVRSVDAQPIMDEVTAGQTSVLVSVSGIIKYAKKSNMFSESFFLTAQPSAQGAINWKIASDCFRYHEPS